MVAGGEPDLRSLVDGPMALGLAARLAVRHLERLGIDAGPLLTASGLSRSAIAERQRISVASQMRFLKLASIASKDQWLGLTLAQDVDLREMGMLYYVAASSRQLGDALKRLSRYVRLGNEALIVRLKGWPGCSVEVSYSGVQRHQDRDQMELLTCAFLRLCRKVVGRNLAPRAVRFVHHRSGDLSPITKMFGCDVKFDADADEVIFDEQVVELPLLGDDPFLNELIVKMCDEAMAGRTTNAGPFRIVVENTIAPLLPHAEASTRTVAKLLGLSERTFSRRLAEEGVGFAEILDHLRRDLAVRYLEEDLQACQIAWLLGFNQPSSFSHACRRWTGKSPLEIRRARKLEPAA